MLLKYTVMGIFGVLLICKAIEDIKKRTIGIYLVVLITIAFMIINIAVGLIPVNEMILGGVLGIAFIIISKLTKQSIGYGDSAVIAAIGLVFGIYMQIKILMTAVIISFIYVLILLLLHRVKMKDSIAFIPFLLAGYVIAVIT